MKKGIPFKEAIADGFSSLLVIGLDLETLTFGIPFAGRSTAPKICGRSNSFPADGTSKQRKSSLPSWRLGFCWVSELRSDQLKEAPELHFEKLARVSNLKKRAFYLKNRIEANMWATSPAPRPNENAPQPLPTFGRASLAPRSTSRGGGSMPGAGPPAEAAQLAAEEEALALLWCLGRNLGEL